MFRFLLRDTLRGQCKYLLYFRSWWLKSRWFVSLEAKLCCVISKVFCTSDPFLLSHFMFQMCSIRVILCFGSVSFGITSCFRSASLKFLVSILLALFHASDSCQQSFRVSDLLHYSYFMLHLCSARGRA